MPSAPSVSIKPLCKECGTLDLSIVYGRFGYYFKCNKCNSNTPLIAPLCSFRHKRRITKEKENFFYYCATCDTQQLFFINPRFLK